MEEDVEEEVTEEEADIFEVLSGITASVSDFLDKMAGS